MREPTTPRSRRASDDLVVRGGNTARPTRTRRSTLAKAAAGASVLLGAALHPSPAFGHSIYETYTVFDDGNRCTKMYAEIDHGEGNGYVYSRTYAYARPVPNPTGLGCNTVEMRPAAFIRSRFTLMRKTGPGVFDMTACLGPDFGGWDPYYAYSDQESFQWGSYYTVPPGGEPPCGYGQYSNLAEGGVRYGDTWNSGSAFPGWHDFWKPK